MTLLKRGSTGAAVKKLQEDLNKLKITPVLNFDGIFGEGTERNVKEAQRRLSLVEDGKVGPQTLRAISQALTPPSNSAKKEPDKSAMWNEGKPLTAPVDPLSPWAPNADTLILLDTTRFINEIIYHCTATPEGKRYTVADVRAWHKIRGFTDVGYHFLIDLDGTILIGRPIGQTGSHVAGHNTGTIGISYFGGLTADAKKAKDTRTPEQIAASLWLVQSLVKKFPTIKKISGHNQYANKACPCFQVPQDPIGRLAA